MDNNNLTTKGDGTCKPDTEASTNTTNPTNTDADAHDKSKGLQTSELKPTISEARLRANRENAKKSTGPKTSRGKAYSRRNALKHGLLIKRILFSSDGTPINAELHDLWESVQEKYGKGDVRTDLLLESLIAMAIVNPPSVATVSCPLLFSFLRPFHHRVGAPRMSGTST